MVNRPRWLQILQELVGIGVTTVYAVDLFKNAGFGDTLSKMLAGFSNLSYMGSVSFAVLTLDKLGRRCEYVDLLCVLPLIEVATMVWGAAGMALVLLIAGILDKYAQNKGPHRRAFEAGVAAMTFLCTTTFGATWLTVP